MLSERIDISIIIVNWNSGINLIKCVNSILKSDQFNGVNIELIVIDNNSNDKSLKNIPENKSITIIRNEKNLGFGAGCNIGIKKSKGLYILILNPDTLLMPDTLKKIYKFYLEHDYSIVGVKQTGENGKIIRGCARKPDFWNCFSSFSGVSFLFPKIFPSYKMIDWDHEDSREVHHVIGSFMFLSKNLFKEIGYFDEEFFLYYEDLDFSKRVRKNGGKIYYWTGAQIFHEGGGSTKNIKIQRIYFSAMSRIKFVRKYFEPCKASLLIFLVLCIEPFNRVLGALVKFNFKDIIPLIKVYRKLHLNLKKQ